MKKILISDSDNASVMYYSVALRGHRKIIALDADDTVTQFLKHKPDLIILGSKLNSGDGFEIASQIREIDKNVKIVMITGDIMSRQLAINAGCDEHYLKPVYLDQLLKIVA